MTVTAKVRVASKGEVDENGTVAMTFCADYLDERNKEWSKFTPALTLQMTVLESVAKQFENGQPFTLTFEESTDDAPE